MDAEDIVDDHAKCILACEDVEQAILDLNSQALGLLKQEDNPASFRLLKHAERLAVSNMRTHPRVLQLLSVTLNNIACYYKKNKCHQIALRYLTRVLQIEKTTACDEKQTASTYLNISAILSCMGKHADALKFAKKANLMYLKAKEKQLEDEAGSQDVSFHTNFIISFFNIATELLNLGRRREAKDIYRQGWEFSKIELGEDHQLTQKLREISEERSSSSDGPRRPGPKQSDPKGQSVDIKEARRSKCTEFRLGRTQSIHIDSAKQEVSIARPPVSSYSQRPKNPGAAVYLPRLEPPKKKPRGRLNDLRPLPKDYGGREAQLSLLVKSHAAKPRPLDINIKDHRLDLIEEEDSTMHRHASSNNIHVDQKKHDTNQSIGVSLDKYNKEVSSVERHLNIVTPG